MVARALIVFLLATSTARAEPLALEGCAGIVDEKQLRALLRIELGRGASLEGRVRCNALEITIGGESLSLAEVPRNMRVRTVALALAERLRRDRLDALAAARARETVEPTPLPLPIPVEPAPSPSPIPERAVIAPAPIPVTPPPPPPKNQRRLYGGLAIGMLSLGLAGIAIGAPLVAIQPADPAFQGVHITGDVFLAISAAALVTSTVTFALWLRERKLRASIP